jgi:2-polyprenyl-6-methoxyphenol hydroxylase-like FAD-dependent oxidoreductase
MLALRLARSEIRVRIIDAVAEPGTTSRALVVHARTLEFYRQMGLADAFLAEAMMFAAVNLWVGGRRVGRAPFGDIGKGLSPFPYMVVCPQDRHERFLIDHLRRAGVEVERPTELLDFTQDGDRVRVRLKRSDGSEETCDAAYLAGCDGARSRVRKVLDTGFPGGTYSRAFYVADVEAKGGVMDNELHVALDEADFLGIFPLMGGRTVRLIGTVGMDQEEDRAALRWEDVGRAAAARMGIEVERVNWFSTYRVHHRVASHFRNGRVFLLGDAAHVHSPVGGQGMNTGIGDAVNLAWKMADVVHGRARPALLDSYEPERMAFARRLVATTDRAFVAATGTGRLARFVRMRVVPLVLPVLVRFAAVRRFMFRTVSQTAITYRATAAPAAKIGSVHVGDRLPWVELDGSAPASDNFAVLDGRGWQLHVYGTPGARVAEACRARGVAMHVFPWRPAMKRAGLTENALYLVRPDGYVGWIAPGDSPDPLGRFIGESTASA